MALIVLLIKEGLYVADTNLAHVTTTTAPGYGNESMKAVAAVAALAFPVLEKDGQVWLTIVKG